MRKNLIRHAVLWMIAAACLCIAVNSAAAGSFTRSCAARDMQLVMLLEARERANAISAEQVNDALLTMLEARLVCYQGRVLDAMALYDKTAHAITGELALSGH